MLPIDKSGKLWDADTANAMVKTIAVETKERLKNADANVIHAATAKRWAEFCSAPQDREAFLAHHLPTERAKYLKEATKRLKAAEVSEKKDAPGGPVDVVTAAEFKCDYCGKPCGSAAGLVSHKRTHG